MYGVMIVDDEKFVRKSIINRIDWQGLDLQIVAEVDNGRDAFKLALQLKPALLLVDIRMPLMNGIELIRRLKEELPWTQYIILSGYDDFEYTKEAIKLGVSNYIKKPVDELELTETLQLIIKNLEEMHFWHKSLALLSSQAEEGLEERNAKYLNQLVHGSAKTDTVLKLKGPAFGLILLYLNISSSAHEVKHLIQETLKRDLSSMYSTDAQIYPFYDDLHKGVLCILWGDRELSSALVQRLTSALIQTLGAAIDITPHSQQIASAFCLVSEKLSDLPSVYNHALHLIKHKILYENAPILSDEIISRNKDNGEQKNFYESTYKALELIKQSIETGNFTQVGKILDGIFGPSQKEKLSIEMIEMIVKEIGIILKKMAVLHKLTTGRQLYDDIFKPDYLLLFQNLEELKECLCSYIRDFSLNMADFREDNIIERIKQYVDLHYGDELTVNHLAKAFYLNPNYLSHLFKNKTTMNLGSYIEDIRIEKAVGLLTNFQVKIKDIALSVGYNDPNYFTKVFKKRTGMTPLEYQQQVIGI